MSETNSRRLFLQQCFTSALQWTLVPAMISSCQVKEEKPKENKAATSSDPCNDYSGLSEAEIKKRTSLGYVKKSPVANKHCDNCNLWLPPAGEEKCGICQLFKGPVPAEAYCTYWAPRV